MYELKIELNFKVSDQNTLDDQTLQLVNTAKKAAERAYAPYSKFHVGAALLMEDGSIHDGNNQENAAYPSGLCAERVAIFHASSVKPGMNIKGIAVYAYNESGTYTEAVSPCGSCRQALLEYENKQNAPIPVHMAGRNGKVISATSIAALLPLAFGSFQLD